MSAAAGHGARARFFVPGRIEVLGKHTDYAGGRALLTAVERGLLIRAAPDDDAAITFVAADAADQAAFPLSREGGRVRVESGGAGGRTGWRRYAAALLARVAETFGDRLTGARIEFGGDLPAAAGLSSSSALITGLFLGLDAVCRFHDDPRFREHLPDRETLAAYLAAIERGSPVPGLDDPRDGPGAPPADRRTPVRGVGTRGGSEDHTAILCAEEGRVVRYGFEPVRRLGSVRLPAEWTFAVACSGVVARKAGGARAPYNRLSDRAGAAAAAWRAATGGAESGLGDALQAAGGEDRLVEAVEEGARRLGVDPATLADRARHFAREVALVDSACEALERQDATALAEAARSSQGLAERLLDNQVPETAWLVRYASERGAVAASAFGAGFGGAVWALVERAEVEPFLDGWRRAYQDAFPAAARRATFFRTGAAAAAGPLPPG